MKDIERKSKAYLVAMIMVAYLAVFLIVVFILQYHDHVTFEQAVVNIDGEEHIVITKEQYGKVKVLSVVNQEELIMINGKSYIKTTSIYDKTILTQNQDLSQLIERDLEKRLVATTVIIIFIMMVAAIIIASLSVCRRIDIKYEKNIQALRKQG